MGFSAMMVNMAQNPFAISLLCTVSIVVITQNLSNLIYQSKITVWLKIAFRIHKAPLRQFLVQPPEIN
jgi:hypothetical protein